MYRMLYTFFSLAFCLLLFFCGSSLADDQQELLKVEVTARQPHHLISLSDIIPQQQLLNDTSFSTDNVAALLTNSPAVNFNGQGGLFQSINIRGFSRWRISTQVEGIPIYTERRAGSAAEFIPPAFVSDAYLIAGAASTQLGSGAIGGGIDLILQAPQQSSLQMSHGISNDYRDILLMGGNKTQSLGWMVNHRHANHSEDANNRPIQDRFEQHSLALRLTGSDKLLNNGLLLYSSANNIAKASSEDPAERFTLYPKNNHLLGKMQFNWHNATIYFHQTQLDTSVIRPGERINQLSNKALSWGVHLYNSTNQKSWPIIWRIGLDARSGVKATESETDNQGIAGFLRTNLNAAQWEAYVTAETRKQFGTGLLVTGFRLAHQSQKETGEKHTIHEQNISAYIGYRQELANYWHLAAYLSNAYRVPSLTERYYNGTTPRGTVSGDTELNPESAVNQEINLAYENNNFSGSISLFQQQIDDYIERITINSELRQYQNLQQAEIQGVSYQGQYSFDWSGFHWQMRMAGQWLSGEDNNHEAIADISPARHRLSLSLFGEDWQSFIAVTHRQASNHEAPGELATKNVTSLDLGYSLNVSEKLAMSLNLSNLNNAHYVVSRDDLAPFAKGRDLLLSLKYNF